VIAIPVDLQLRIGRKQLWRSLQTERYKDARIHARKIFHRADELFFILRYQDLDSNLIDALVAEFALHSLEVNYKLNHGFKLSPDGREEDSNTAGACAFYSSLIETAEGRESLSKVQSSLSDAYKTMALDKKQHEIPYLTEFVDAFLQKTISP
jgi:hypothetical protein